MDIKSIVKDNIKEKDGIWYGPGEGYWSNIDQSMNNKYLKDLKTLGSKKTVRRYFPQNENTIFSLKRAGGIAALDYSQEETILDAGCMWGALSIPLARTKANVIAVDQTEESLRFLKQRKDEEKLKNLHLIRADLKTIDFRKNVFDKIIINGVLEWIPEEEKVEVYHFVKRNKNILHNVKLFFRRENIKVKPIEEQRLFLKKIYSCLKEKGCLYLAIENRYDLFYFLGLPEQHCGIRFISLLPRFMQDGLSLLLRGRRFRSWTHSKIALTKLLQSAGFCNIDFNYAFPNYREPEFILCNKGGMKFFRYYKSVGKKPLYKKIILRLIEEVVYRRLRLGFFTPSFIVHAYK